MKILLDDDLEALLVKHSFEGKQQDSGLSLLADFLGFFSDPISSLLAPFIKLWEIEVERKKVEILQEQLRERNELYKRAIDARLLEVTIVIRQRQREFEIIHSAFQRQFKKSDYFQKVHGQAFAKLIDQLPFEKDPIRSRLLHKSIEVISNNMSQDMNGMLHVISSMVTSQLDKTSTIIKQLNQ